MPSDYPHPEEISSYFILLDEERSICLLNFTKVPLTQDTSVKQQQLNSMNGSSITNKRSRTQAIKHQKLFNREQTQAVDHKLTQIQPFLYAT